MRRAVWLVLGVLAAVITISLLAAWIAPNDPLATDLTSRNQSPSQAHWLGTDSLGRDVASRLVFGGRGALLISGAATLTSMLVGTVLGSLAGWFGTVVDTAVQMLLSIFQGLPGLSISIAVVGVLGASKLSIFWAMVLTGWSGVARVARSQVRELREEQFVIAARVYRPGTCYLLVQHLLPHMLATLVVLAMHRMGRMILAIAALSFIGVGLQPPTPDWGVMIQDARQYTSQQPWALLAPSLMLFVTAFSLARLGELLRDHWDVSTDQSGTLR